MRRLVPTLLCLLAVGAVGAADEVRVVAVEVVGATRVAESTVRGLLMVRPGREYPRALLLDRMADDVRALDAMGPFAGSRVEIAPAEGGLRLIYRLSELPALAAVSVVGVSPFQLDAYEKLLATKRGGYLNPVQLEADRSAILRKLQDDGYRQAQVTVRVGDRDGFKTVEFACDPGLAVLVGRVVLEPLPEGVRPWMLDPVLFNAAGRPYEADRLEIDRQAVVRLLREQGYLHARLRRTTVEWNDHVHPLEPRHAMGPRLVPDGQRNDRAVIVYEAEPGQRFRLGSVTFVGTTLAGQDELRRAFTRRDLWGEQVMLEDGEPYVKRVIDAAAERSRRLISDRGYAQCRIELNARERPGTDLVDLTVTIVPGREFSVGRVDVDGNEVTRDPVVRRALAIGPGDRWSDTQVEESERQLRRIGLFDADPRLRPRIERSFPDDRPGEVDLSVRVAERPTGSFSFQIGYSALSGAFGQIGYRESNFDLFGLIDQGFPGYRGGGLTLDASVRLAELTSSFAVGLTQPHLLDGPYSASVQLERSESTARDWDEERLSGTLTLGRAFLRNDLRLNLGYRYTDLAIAKVDDDAADDVRETTAFQNTLILGQSLDRLNNRQIPTAGWAVSLGQELTGSPLPASSAIFEYSARSEGYLPLAQDADGGTTVLRAAARWRHLIPFAGDDDLPFYERLTGGGPAPRHRGYAPNRLGPRRINARGLVSYPGGDRDLLTTVELITSLTGNDSGLRALVFADTGNIWAEDAEPTFRSLRTAVGMGIRLPADLLPVALDVAWLLDGRDDEDRFQFHFGVALTRF